MQKFKKIIFLLIFIILIQACSSLAFYYKRLHVIVIKKLDNNFNLSKKQKSFVENRVIYYLKWQKESELLAYKKHLNQLVFMINNGFSEDELFDYWQKSMLLYNRSLNYLVPDIEKFFLSLENEQVDYYLKNRSEIDKQKLNFIAYPEKEYNKIAHDRAIARFEKYVGDFSNYQKIKIRAIYDYDQKYAKQLLMDDIYARNNFASKIKYNKGSNNFSDWTKKVVLSGDILYSREGIERKKRFQNIRIKRLYRVYLLLDKKQKANLIKEISVYINAIDDIRKQ